MKEFKNIAEIQKYFSAKEKSSILAKKNYYIGRTKMIMGEYGMLKKYEKKLETYKKNLEKKITKQIEKAIEAFSKGKKGEPKKEKKPLSITKDMTKREVQLYAKIGRADKNGMVKEITTGQLMPRYETQGGHFIPAQRNSTCFDVDNIRPQLPKSNFDMSQGGKQAEIEREKYRRNLIKEIGENNVEYLERQKELEKKDPSQFKMPKSKYKQIYTYYKKLNDRILAEQGRSRKKPYILP